MTNRDKNWLDIIKAGGSSGDLVLRCFKYYAPLVRIYLRNHAN